MQTLTEKQLSTGRRMYILQAALEYLIAIAVGGSFLATLTKEIGMSDSLTGIITSITSLGGLFQLLALFVRTRKIKRFVIGVSILNQLLFIALYFVPGLAMGREISGAVFAFIIVSANLLYNLASPHKSSWMMSMVDPRQRGIFSAHKEMFSLLLGMGFSFGMGWLFDHMEAQGKLYTAFAIMVVAMVVCMLLAAMTMLLTAENPALQKKERRPLLPTIKTLLGDRRMRMVFGLHMLYTLFNNVAVPFYGTYQLVELNFSLTLISSFGILSSVARMIVSPRWGQYADRHSFVHMVEKALLVLGASFLCVALANPANGLVMFALYYLLHGIAMGGANSAMFNIIFEYAPAQEQSNALAICNALSGAAGFLTTVVMSLVVTAVQQNGSQVLGATIYAQQILSLVSVLGILGTVVYLRHFFPREKR